MCPLPFEHLKSREDISEDVELPLLGPKTKPSRNEDATNWHR